MHLRGGPISLPVKHLRGWVGRPLRRGRFVDGRRSGRSVRSATLTVLHHGLGQRRTLEEELAAIPLLTGEVAVTGSPSAISPELSGSIFPCLSALRS